MTRPIGYYVHHHGDGHRQRALAIAREAPERFVMLGTGLAGRTDGVDCIDLPDDRTRHVFDGQDGSDDRPASLHYAPVDHAGVRDRVARIVAWIAAARPSMMVVDVSVEVAMLARLAATPTLYVRQNGVRNDPPHLEAFRGARRLLAPFHASLDHPEIPGWVRDKTVYCPGLAVTTAHRTPRAEVVLVVIGKGGPPGQGDRIARAARACPDLQWRVAGPVSPVLDPPANLTLLGWTGAMAEEIAGAGIVVGAAGLGLVTAVLATGRPFICLPEERPFEEQTSTAARLQGLGAALVLHDWPMSGHWPAIIARARELDPAVALALHDPDGAARTAAWLIAQADPATTPSLRSTSR